MRYGTNIYQYAVFKITAEASTFALMVSLLSPAKQFNWVGGVDWFGGVAVAAKAKA